MQHNLIQWHSFFLLFLHQICAEYYYVVEGKLAKGANDMMCWELFACTAMRANYKRD